MSWVDHPPTSSWWISTLTTIPGRGLKTLVVAPTTTHAGSAFPELRTRHYVPQQALALKMSVAALQGSLSVKPSRERPSVRTQNRPVGRTIPPPWRQREAVAGGEAAGQQGAPGTQLAAYVHTPPRHVAVTVPLATYPSRQKPGQSPLATMPRSQ